MSSRRVAFDVGANVGEFGLSLAERNPSLSVVCIEPVALLAARIRDSALARQLSNVSVLEDAVGLATGEALLHVAERGDWGVSSLLDFAAEQIAGDEYWSQRADLSFTGSQTVHVRRLEELIIDSGADVVDFVKIDVQGLDLEVLQSAGDSLSHIRAGMLEVPTVPRVRLYEQEQHTLRTALALLHDWGFETYAIKPNDPACNEVNVFFARSGEDPAQLERELSLRGIGLYDGKHFWDRPAGSWQALQVAADERAERDARLRSLEPRVHDLESRLTSTEPLVAARDERVARLDAELARGEERIALLDAELARREERIAALNAELARQNERIGVLDHELQRVHQQALERETPSRRKHGGRPTLGQ